MSESTREAQEDARNDALVCEEVLRDMLDALTRGPRTRYRALAATHLEIAAHFLHDAGTKEAS